MAHLIIFWGPTRTATTSLFFSQECGLHFVDNVGYINISKTKISESYFHRDCLSSRSHYDYRRHLLTFRDPKADILVEYAPSLFHESNSTYLSNYISEVAQHHTVSVILTIRPLLDLLTSVVSYDWNARASIANRLAPAEATKSAISSLLRYFDYGQAISDLNELTKQASIRIVLTRFSSITTTPNDILTSAIACQVGAQNMKERQYLFYKTPLLRLNSRNRRRCAPMAHIPLFSKMYDNILPSRIKLAIRDRLLTSQSAHKHAFNPDEFSVLKSDILELLSSNNNHLKSPLLELTEDELFSWAESRTLQIT